MLNLVPAIKSIEAEIQKIKAEYRRKIEPYETSINELRKLNEACERCNGKGKILRSRACAEDDRPDPRNPSDWETCLECKGSGRAKTPEEKESDAKFALDFEGISP